MNWSLACPDWADRLRMGRSLVPDLPHLDLVAGNRAVAVFNKLRLADVPGTPTMEEASGDWFRDIVRALFGSIDRETGRRMIRELFALVPKKNSKTTNGALLMLTALLLNERPRAPMGMAAPVQDVAEIAFNAIAGAIALDPVLEKKLHVRDHLKTIVHRETKATLEVMTFDPAALTGPKWAAFLLDEVHQIAKASKAAKAFRQIKGGMLPYPEAFLAQITTQSDDPPVGIFESELRKARAIRDGKIEGSMLPVLYEFPEEMQRDPLVWRNPANWSMVTPNLGRSVQLHSLVEGMKDAEQTSDAELRAWASQHLNVQIGIALTGDSWAGALFWEQQGDPSLTLEQLLARSEVVTVGIDGGGLDDMLALAVIGREVKTGKWLHWAHAWLHPIALERRKKEASRYRDFEKDGDLTIVEKIGDDVEQLADYVKRVDDSGLLERIGVDQAGIESVVEAIWQRKVRREIKDTDRVVAISQGWRIMSSIQNTERKLAEGMLAHGASRLMAWCVSNAKVEPRGNAILITKQISGSAKIDPVLATLNASTLMALNPESPKKKIHMFTVG
jgi:phage terminase large subunit-like protein